MGLGQLHVALGRLRRGPRSPALTAFAAGALLGVVTVFAAVACGPVVPSGTAGPVATPAASGSGAITPPASGEGPSPSAAAVDPRVGRLVWLVDRTGSLGVWTTDLAGGDARTYLAGLDEEGVTLRDAALAGDDIVLIRDGPTSGLWLIPATGTPRILLDRVAEYRLIGTDEVVAARDIGKMREIWRVSLRGPAPVRLGAIPPAAADGEQLGPFGVAVSPDGRTIAAGWVGGQVRVFGPAPANLVDVGAPLVVDDDGAVVAVTGRAGEAYVRTGDVLEELAPADADPLALAGAGAVAWGVAGADGALERVEVHDLFGGTGRAYPAEGAATNIREFGADHVLLEATAFDPLHRTVAYLDLADGGFAVFDADAPEATAP